MFTNRKEEREQKNPIDKMTKVLVIITYYSKHSQYNKDGKAEIGFVCVGIDIWMSGLEKSEH